MANELVIADLFLVATLAASSTLATDATGGIWSAAAPAGTTGKWVIFQMQSPGTDQMVVGSARLMVAPLYQVVAVGQVNDFGSLQTVADAIDAALHGVNGTQSGYAVHSVRENPLALIVTEGTIQYRKLGGLYRLYIQQ